MAKVFLDYDQKSLDRAYDQKAWASNMEDILGEYRIASLRVRKALGEPAIYNYGPTPAERMEVFRANATSAPVQIFVHGGAWRRGAASDYSFLAETFIRSGIHFVAVDFAAVTAVEGDLSVLATQVMRAIAWAYTNAWKFGGDPDQLFLAGHSSGAHLAAVAATADWAASGVPGNILKGGLLVSGMYDLKPVRLSARSSYVKLDDGSEEALSPIRHLDRLQAPLVVAWGSAESPEFIRQGQTFVSAGNALGKQIGGVQIDGLNHFEALNTLVEKQSVIGRSALGLIGLVQQV
jgi:arylformamidase